MVLKVKIRLCSSGSIAIDGKEVNKQGGAKKPYYTYKGSRFSKIHMVNRRKHIYSAKEKMYIPITSKDVKKGGGENTNGGQCLTEEVNVYIPKPILDIILKEAQKNPDTASRMRLYFALGMRDKMTETRGSMLQYVADAIKDVLKFKSHIMIRPEYFDSIAYSGKKIQRVFSIDRNGWNASDPVKCTMESWRYKKGQKVQVDSVEESTLIERLEQNTVIAKLFNYLSSLDEPMYISCSEKEFHWDNYFPSGLEDKLGMFTKKANAKGAKELLDYVEERNFLGELRQYINAEKRGGYGYPQNAYYAQNGYDNGYSANWDAPQYQEPDIREELYKHIESIISNTRMVLQKNSTVEKDFTSVVKDLSNVILCMQYFFAEGQYENEDGEPDFDFMWEIFFPIPDHN